MQWQTLYTTLRSGDAGDKKQRNPDAARTSFQRDYDRLIFSSAFRRLQNKTQVFPLPGVVFVHNRLTHSLEVASVGRSLGKAAGDAIADSHAQDGRAGMEHFYRYELPSVIAAACLAHDIGNPPFGHSGENAIRSFFEDADGVVGDAFETELSQEQQQDFLRFEGNANAIRILAHPFNEGEPGGYNLTLTTLAAILKYPCASHEGFDKTTGLIATKKSGYFQSEAGLMQRIAAQLSIPQKEQTQTAYARHPFVFLTEAADDVCYRIMDAEDAHRLHLVTTEEVLHLFLPFFEDEKDFNGIDAVRAKLDSFQDANQKIQYLRARWIGLMTGMLKDAFLNEEDALLNGTLEQPLFGRLPQRLQGQLKEIDRFSVQRIYRDRAVLEIEIAGYEVIGGLLKAFAGAAFTPKHSKSEKLLQLIPRQFKMDGAAYQKFQAVVDFISGMTDLYATDLYRKITGISMGGM